MLARLRSDASHLAGCRPVSSARCCKQCAARPGKAFALPWRCAMSIVANTVPASLAAPGLSGVLGRLLLLCDPPSACPGCLAQAGQPWPADTTSRFCPRCRDRLRRMAQVRRWNRDPVHQAMAGRASFDAFSARWRAQQGLATLSADAARRYVTPDMIRLLGHEIDPQTRQTIYRGWCQGWLYGVPWWTPERLAAFASEQDAQEAPHA